MIACVGAQLWWTGGLLVVGLLVGPWVAWKLREAEVRGQYSRHPAGGDPMPRHVTVVRPPINAAECRIALAQLNDGNPGAGALYDQDTEGVR